MLKWLVLISGAGVLLFNIFVYTGGNAKFKSDLPDRKRKKKAGKKNVS